MSALLPVTPGASGGPARQASIRRHNLALLLAELDGPASLTRAELSRRTGLTKATVSSLVEALLGAELVEELPELRQLGERAAGALGRPGSPLALPRAGPAALGIEIAADYLAVCVVDLTGALRHHRLVIRDNRRGAPEETLRVTGELCAEISGVARGDGLRLFGAGVALPGVVTPDGVLRFAPNLPSFLGLPVSELFAQALQPVVPRLEVGNEANLAALAELWYGGQDLSDFVHVSGEIGVGAGLVVDGRLYPGFSGAAGELGHLTVIPDGPPCGCGARGCLEQLAGQEALLRAAGVDAPASTSTGGENAAVTELLRRAQADDPLTLAALEAAGHALGLALSGTLNLVDVPVVVLGGLYAELAPFFLRPMQAELALRVVRHRWSPVRVLVSHLGPEAAVRGAAGSMVRSLLADPAAFIPHLLASA